MDVGDGARARETRIHMDDSCPALAGLHHPSKGDRMAFRHIRPLNDDEIRILQILREGSGSAPSKRGPQTGDRGGMSNTGLIFDLDNPESSEELLDQIVLFVVESRAAQVSDRHGPP